MTTLDILKAAKAAAPVLAQTDTAAKNAALLAMADALVEATDDILSANALDVEAAKEKLGSVMVDRLALNSARIAGMAEGIRQVAALPDPVGEVRERYIREDGLIIEKDLCSFRADGSQACPLDQIIDVFSIFPQNAPNIGESGIFRCVYAR